MSVSPSSSARLAGAAAAILLASAPVFVHAAPGAVPPVVVAVQASGSGAIERSFISASVDHLTYALPDTPLVFRYLPLGEIQKLAESRRVDFVLAPPDGYVVLERFFGARSLVSQTIRESSSADSVLGIVVAVNAAKAPDASASVLNGASILVPELDGMPARMLRRELMHAGVERAVPEALRTKTDDPEGAILEAVASGRADAGILPACYVERLSATDPKRLSGIRLVTTDRASQTRCRSFSVFYPGWTLASFPHTPPELNALVSGTLLGMPTDADGCDWRPGARYDAVHELLEALGDAAYLRQSQFSWAARRHPQLRPRPLPHHGPRRLHRPRGLQDRTRQDRLPEHEGLGHHRPRQKLRKTARPTRADVSLGPCRKGDRTVLRHARTRGLQAHRARRHDPRRRARDGASHQQSSQERRRRHGRH